MIVINDPSEHFNYGVVGLEVRAYNRKAPRIIPGTPPVEYNYY